MAATGKWYITWWTSLTIHALRLPENIKCSITVTGSLSLPSSFSSILTCLPGDNCPQTSNTSLPNMHWQNLTKQWFYFAYLCLKDFETWKYISEYENSFKSFGCCLTPFATHQLNSSLLDGECSGILQARVAASNHTKTSSGLFQEGGVPKRANLNSFIWRLIKFDKSWDLGALVSQTRPLVTAILESTIHAKTGP